jgi:sirohydrochlorin cobaltochelatase
VKTSFSDAGLLLIGHGSTVNDESAAPVYQHAEELRRRCIFAEVREAFWKQEPGISAVLRLMAVRRIFAVPLFVSGGYFTEEVIPVELGLRQPGDVGFAVVRQDGERTLWYCPAVGTHESMTCVILARAQEVVFSHPFPWAPRPADTALFIAGHGTERNGKSRRAIERAAGLIRALGTYAEVHAVFLEEEPRIERAYGLAQARNLVMIPFFISDGLHSYQDIPVMLGESERLVRQRLERGLPTWRNPTERQGKRLWYGRSVGTDPHLSEVILERVREVAAGQLAGAGAS